jgi:hypothetical protein
MPAKIYEFSKHKSRAVREISSERGADDESRALTTIAEELRRLDSARRVDISTYLCRLVIRCLVDYSLSSRVATRPARSLTCRHLDTIGLLIGTRTLIAIIICLDCGARFYEQPWSCPRKKVAKVYDDVR